MRRALLLLAAAAISLAATFGGPEEIDPKAGPIARQPGQLGVDGAGHVLYLTERDAKALVLERCTGGWQPVLETGTGVAVQDLAVAPSGAAVAVWVQDLDELWTAYRSPDGSWGAPQKLATNGNLEAADAAIDANGDVVLAWQASSGNKVSASFRPAATREWEQPTPLAGFVGPRVAILNGAATVVTSDKQIAPTKLLAFPRPWGGTPETVTTWQGSLGSGPWLAYDPGTGQPVVLYVDDFNRQVRVSARGAGGWTVAPSLEQNMVGQSVAEALARHPNGLVAVWRRTDGGMVVRRGSGGSWDSPQVFGGTYPEDVTAAADADGEIVVAGARDDGEIWAATAQSIGGAWSSLSRLSAAGPGWRFPLAAGGGGRLVVAWGDHRGGQQRTLASVSGDCAATPQATPTPTPQPPPPPATQPPPKPKAVTLADVVTLPSSKKCRNSLKLKFRKPAKSVAMTVNGKKLKVKIGKAVTIKLRKRTTLKITVTLADGSKLKSTARFRPC